MATVFSIDFSEISEEDFFLFVETRIRERDPCYVVTPNLHFARLAQTDESFRKVIGDAALRLCDSAVLSGMLALMGRRLPARLTGSDLTPKLFALAEKRSWRVFLFGSDEMTLEKVRRRYPSIVNGTAAPPVHERPWSLDSLNARFVADIQQANPDLLFVALGARKQEYWAQKYFDSCRVPIVICIGASLDFLGAKSRRAPKILSKIGLEWLWRLTMEPSRLWRRYSGDAAFLLRHGLPELFRR